MLNEADTNPLMPQVGQRVKLTITPRSHWDDPIIEVGEVVGDAGDGDVDIVLLWSSEAGQEPGATDTLLVAEVARGDVQWEAA